MNDDDYYSKKRQNECLYPNRSLQWDKILPTLKVGDTTQIDTPHFNGFVCQDVGKGSWGFLSGKGSHAGTGIMVVSLLAAASVVANSSSSSCHGKMPNCFALWKKCSGPESQISMFPTAKRLQVKLWVALFDLKVLLVLDCIYPLRMILDWKNSSSNGSKNWTYLNFIWAYLIVSIVWMEPAMFEMFECCSWCLAMPCVAQLMLWKRFQIEFWWAIITNAGCGRLI